MLWAVPHRRAAALCILFAAITVSLLLLDFCFLGNLRALSHGFAQAGWLSWTPESLSPGLLARILARFFFDAAPAALLTFFCAITAWFVSPRIRFFGNTAPLIVFLMLLVMAIFLPENGASATLLATLPFLLLFISGVFADLIEGNLQAPALGVIFAVIAAQAAYSIASLMRMYSRLPGS
jgi:hypothetical protein